MTREITFKNINRIAIPSMLMGIAEPLIGLVDSYLVGNMPLNGTEALGAVSLGTQLFMLLFWIFIQTETSLSSIIAKALGKDDLKSTEALISQGLILNFIIGCILWGLSNLFISSIFDLYQAEGLVKEMAIEYYSIRSMGFPIVLSTGLLWGVFRGLQNTSWAMTIGILGGLVNLGLDFAFIYGIDPWIPAMGVKGAAYGSLGAQCFMLIITGYFFFKKTPLSLTWLPRLHHQFKTLLSSSKDFMIRGLSLNAVIFLSYSFATSYGKEELAAHGVAMQFWLLSAFLLDGYAHAGQAISGKLSGANEWKLIDLLTGRLLKVSLVVSFGIMVLYSVGLPWITEYYFQEIEVGEIFKMIMIYVISVQIINGLAFTYDGILKGILASKYIMYLMLTAMLVFVAFLLFLDYMFPGIQAVWIALSIWMLLRAIAPYFYLKKKTN